MHRNGKSAQYYVAVVEVCTKTNLIVQAFKFILMNYGDSEEFQSERSDTALVARPPGKHRYRCGQLWDINTNSLAHIHSSFNSLAIFISLHLNSAVIIFLS